MSSCDTFLLSSLVSLKSLSKILMTSAGVIGGSSLTAYQGVLVNIPLYSIQDLSVYRKVPHHHPRLPFWEP